MSNLEEKDQAPKPDELDTLPGIPEAEETAGNSSQDELSLTEKLQSIQHGFQVSPVLPQPPAPQAPVTSTLSPHPAIEYAQMVELDAGEGLILYYPKKVDFEIGDVLYLRERENGENGLIVQAVEKGTATYPQADSKALFRLMASVRAFQIQRSHHEPPETIDEFLSLKFKVRAAIVNGTWQAHEGRVVTRNVDIFQIDPSLLLKEIILSEPGLNVDLGDYKSEQLHVFGGGFEKVNLITGMKGGGKSHITKGVISESLKLGMSAIVFDINGEYDKVSPNSLVLHPGENLKFRLDYMEIESFIRLADRLAPFPERTAYAAYASLPRLVEARKQQKHVPDIPFLKGAVNQVITGNSPAEQAMKLGYLRSLEIVESYRLIMTEKEAIDETNAMSKGQAVVPMSLRTAFNNMLAGQPQVLIFQIGGLQLALQKIIVLLVLDHLRQTCAKQHSAYAANKQPYPIYPSVFFEEAHMYMEERDINELVPVIRHIGINVFFVTNTPGALPDSVFRLLDNLVMTRMINRKDIDRLVDCGLVDKETIVGFAQNLRDHHALFLSAKSGATKNFPLVFHVRDFGLPKSGQTRSQWEAMRTHLAAQASQPAGGLTVSSPSTPPPQSAGNLQAPMTDASPPQPPTAP